MHGRQKIMEQKTKLKRQSKEIQNLFKNGKVITAEQLEPFIIEDSEAFWCGDGKKKGMLQFLETNGFDIIECRKKGEELKTEIYVNFDKFLENYPKPEPSVYVSTPALELCDIKTIKEWALTLAKTLGKGLVEISIYGKGGFKLFFSRDLTVDYNKFTKEVLAKLSEEMGLEFGEREDAKLNDGGANPPLSHQEVGV